MNDSHLPNRNFQNQSFPNYDGPIQAVNARYGVLDRVFNSALGQKLKNPVVGTAVLLLAGAAFAGIIISSYPSGGDGEVPVIKAQQTAFKTSPDDPGGMSMPFEDSTIFSTIRGDQGGQARPVENLLASAEDEQAVDRDAFFAEAQNKAQDLALAEAQARIAPAAGDGSTTDANQDVYFLEPSPPAHEKARAETAKTEEPFAIKKIESSSEKILPVDEYKGDETAEAPQQAKPAQISKPGTSPDTLAFVRSVLDEKDAKSTVSEQTITQRDDQEMARRMASVAPSAGAAVSTAGNALQSGSFYVQVASVGSETGAHSEWTKIQKTYSGLLQNASYRVKRADLDRGTFYRIQVGPMSKDQANAMCDSIKAQKPGGCLVTR